MILIDTPPPKTHDEAVRQARKDGWSPLAAIELADEYMRLLAQQRSDALKAQEAV